MKRIAAIAALLILSVVGLPDVPPADAHNVTENSYAIARWFDVLTFGPEPNGVNTYTLREVHWWGSHQVNVCYINPNNGLKAEVLYDRISGAYAYPDTNWAACPH